MKRNYDNYIHYSVAAVGGFFGGFAVTELSGIFGNAQTVNLLSVVRDAFAGEPTALLLRLLGAFAYLLGLSLSVLVPRFTRLRSERLALWIDLAAIIALVFIPSGVSPLVRVYPIFFAASYQWTVFDRIEGYVSATIFSSNNYRQFTTSLLSYAIDKDRKALAKARVFGFTLLYFHLGASLACLGFFFIGGLWVLLGILPIASSALLLVLKSKSSGSLRAE